MFGSGAAVRFADCAFAARILLLKSWDPSVIAIAFAVSLAIHSLLLGRLSAFRLDRPWHRGFLGPPYFWLFDIYDSSRYRPAARGLLPWVAASGGVSLMLFIALVARKWGAGTRLWPRVEHLYFRTIANLRYASALMMNVSATGLGSYFPDQPASRFESVKSDLSGG
jgi:hypothetical protein